jgi:YbbR domain-containing protein
MKFFNFISERTRAFFSWDSASKSDATDSSHFENREKIIAFSVALFFALCLWFIVNLSRDFNVTIQVPIVLSNLPSDVTISSDIPETASVVLTGEGWNLISVYTNPPRVLVNAESDEVNLAEQLRSQIGAFSDLNIVQVRPTQLFIQKERRVSRMLPVRNRTTIRFTDQFGQLSDPVLSPDSVIVTGAESILDELEYWDTADTELTNINQSIDRAIQLQSMTGVSLEPSTVNLSMEVAEFTEAEIRVPIRTRNLPSGRAVSYNPSSILVRYDVPIHQFSEVQGVRLFNAFVDYSLIEEDDLGTISPDLEIVENDFNVRIRSFQPPRVSYFRIVPE